MENFDWTQFSKRVYINSDLASVYAHWTTSAALEKWFLAKALFKTKNGDSISPTEPVQTGDIYQWTWFAQNYHEEGTIIETNGIDYLSFSFAGNCTVKIKMSQVKHQTLVELIQSAIPIDNASKENIRLGCAFGWTFYLINLKSVLEGGLDLRNKDTELIGVVNN